MTMSVVGVRTHVMGTPSVSIFPVVLSAVVLKGIVWITVNVDA